MNNYIYILLAAITVFLIRVLPICIFQKEINNRFFKSFLYYLPYITLSLMIFPSIIEENENPLIGIIALLIGIVLSYKGVKMFKVTILLCLSVFILSYLI